MLRSYIAIATVYITITLFYIYYVATSYIVQLFILYPDLRCVSILYSKIYMYAFGVALILCTMLVLYN